MNAGKDRPTNDKEPLVRARCEACGADFFARAGSSLKRARCPECGRSPADPPPAPPLALQESPTEPSEPAAEPGGEPGGEAASPPPEADPPVKLRLEDDVPAPEDPTRPVEKPEEERPASSRGLTRADRVARARLSGWLRPVLIVLVGFATVAIFEGILMWVPGGSGKALHDVVNTLGKLIATFSDKRNLLRVPRTVLLGVITPLERFVLGVVLLTFAARLVGRTRLLDVVYVRSNRWADRSSAGLVFHFIVLFGHLALVAWIGSLTKHRGASDGMVCGLIAVFFLVSAAWLATLHLVASHEFPQITTRMITHAVVGVVVLIIVVRPELPRLWTRTGATALVCFIDTVLAVRLGASVTFGTARSGSWWRRSLFVVTGAVGVVCVAVVLACIR